MPDGGARLRSTRPVRTPNQPVERARNGPGDDPARHGEAHFAAACSSLAQKGGFQPHRFRSWLTPVPDPQREEKLPEGCALSLPAQERAKQGERTISLDEFTGVQA